MMQIEHTAEREEDRLSTDEVYALRVRLFGEASVPREVTTVADLAAVSARSPEEIWYHLDRLRAERAFEAYTKRPWRLQAAMIGLVVAVVAGGYNLYSAMTPPSISDAESEAALQRSREIRSRQPKKIRYPIEGFVPIDQAPFPGFAMTVRTMLTTTAVKPDRMPGPVTADVARRDLKASMWAAFEAARKAEAAAPRPPKAFKETGQPWEPKPNSKAMMMSFGLDGRGEAFAISTDPQLAKAEISRVAADYVRTIERNQAFALKEPDDPRIDVFPPGFGLTVKMGDSSHGFGSPNTLALRPIDPVAARGRLERAIRNAVRRVVTRAESPQRVGGAIPPRLTEVVAMVTGPIRPYEINLPLREGGEFPVAADAWRAFEDRLEAGLDEAVRQVREANAGKATEK